MQLRGILNRNVDFRPGLAIPSIRRSRRTSGEGGQNICKGTKETVQPLHRPWEPVGTQPQRPSCSVMTKSSPGQATSESSGSLEIEFPQRGLWVPSQCPPCHKRPRPLRAHVPEVRGHEATGRTWKQKPLSSCLAQTCCPSSAPTQGSMNSFSTAPPWEEAGAGGDLQITKAHMPL